MRLFGRDIYWSEPPLQQRSLDRVTSIDFAFNEAQQAIIGLSESSVPAVFRAKQLLSDTVASLPMQAVSGKVVTTDTPLLLTEPDPTQTYHETMGQVMLSLLDYGNAYLWVRTRDEQGNPRSVYVLDPREVTVTWDRSRLYRLYSWRDQTMTEGKELIHIAINRGPGEVKGQGPIEAAQTTALQAARAEEAVARTLAEDNYTPSLVIKTPEAKTKTESELILNTWMEGRDAQGRRKRPAVLGGGATLEQIAFKPVDAQWIEGRNFTVQQIGRLFGLHGFFLLVDSGSSLTYSTTESLFRLFLTATLRPTYLERIEQSFSRLLPTGLKARFNTEEILRADILSRYQAHDIGLGGKGFLTVNEVRAQEGLSAIPGGDDMLAVSIQDPSQRTPRAQLNGAAGR